MGPLVLQLSATFTAPTAHTWRQIALGWVLHRKPAVVTGIIRILGDLADRTWTVYHKFFYRAAWQLHMLCNQLLIHAVGPMIHEAGQVDGRIGHLIADLNIDDTIGRVTASTWHTPTGSKALRRTVRPRRARSFIGRTTG